MANDDAPIVVSDGDESSCDEASGSEEESSDKKEPTLSKEQQHALDAAKQGRNIFITGSAGVGKSFLLKEILKLLPSRTTYVTASTGVAACNIGGTTLHSFAGIGLGDKSVMVLVSQILKRNQDVKKRWTGCKVLVIDEISMIDGHLFEKVEQIAQLIRGNSRPFGGIQVILCGDFLQLPPVKSNYFAFETNAWSTVVDETIVLKKVFRQNDVGFITLLNRLRTGQFTPLDVEVLNTCRHTKFIEDGIKATRLFPHRYSCDDLNNRELKKLKGPAVVYEAVDRATKPMYIEMLDKNSKYAKKLEIKVGAQVMLLMNKNVKGHLVNGARGVVLGFRDRSRSLEADLQAIQEKNNKGNELGGAMKGKDIFENTILQDEFEGNPSDDEESDPIDNENVAPGSNFRHAPIVLFANNVIDVINPENLQIVAAGKNVASRTQIPLSLAWAVSVHKSQGMTLDRIDVNLAESFEHGQSYVALSRVTSLEGLLLRDFKARKITAHPKVLKYYKKIDPTFEQFPPEGDKQLRAFIERKKPMEGYEEMLKQIQDRNDSSAPTNNKFASPAPSCSKTPLSVPASSKTNYNSPVASSSKTLSYNETPNIKNFNSRDFSPLTSSKSLNNEKDNLKSWNPSVKEPGPARPLFSASQALLKADQVLAECRTSIDNELNTVPSENVVTIDSDDDICASKDSGDDVIFNENKSLVKDNSKSSAPNDFFDNICPDLLESAVEMTPLVPNSAKRKRSDLASSSSENEDEKIKMLLKEKAAEIERKKQAALERRRQSMLQRSANSKHC